MSLEMNVAKRLTDELLGITKICKIKVSYSRKTMPVISGQILSFKKQMFQNCYGIRHSNLQAMFWFAWFVFVWMQWL